jgi:uncharacterized membrane protein YedE/YeeE
MAVASLAATAAPSAAVARRPPDRAALLLALGLLTLGTLGIGAAEGARMAALFLVGAGLGVALFHGAFGFTAGWRQFIASGDGHRLRAQFFVVGLTMVLFMPLIAGWLPGISVGGFIAPVGVSVLVGAFLFGVGMQLGNGCGSGTLFTAGGGSPRMVIVLLAFIVGSVLGAAHLPWWLRQPGLSPVDLARSFGVVGAVVAQAGALALLAWGTLAWERRRGLGAEQRPAASHWLRGPWPLVVAGLALVGLNLLILLLAGHPWGITSAFALWGAKLVTAAGVDLSQFEAWASPGAQAALRTSVLSNSVSVTDFGLVAGAMLAAFLGGIASGSLHGWLWFAAAFAGAVVGVRLRPRFGLSRD